MTRAPLVTLLEDDPLSLEGLARAVGAEEAWIVRLVEVDILQVQPPGLAPGQWRFGSLELERARAVRALVRDFDASLDAAALILDLRAEIRRLNALLAAYGAS